jgi:hypothetical protein
MKLKAVSSFVLYIPDNQQYQYEEWANLWVESNASATWCQSQSQSQSYITTDSQSASPSWCQAPIWEPATNFSHSLFDYF